MDEGVVEAELEKAVASLRASLAALDGTEQSEFRQAMLLHDHAKAVEAALLTQAEFATDLVVNTLNGATGFGAGMASSLLLRLTLSIEPKAAVQWLRKILGTSAASGLAVYSMRGLSVEQPVQLTDTVRLVPFTALPESDNTCAFSEAVARRPSVLSSWYESMESWCALVRPLSIEPFLSKPDVQPPRPPMLEPGQEFESIRHCLAIACGAPVLPGPSWFQFDDPDLQRAVLGVMTSFQHQEVTPLFLGQRTALDANAAVTLARAYFTLESTPDTNRYGARALGFDPIFA